MDFQPLYSMNTAFEWFRAIVIKCIVIYLICPVTLRTSTVTFRRYRLPRQIPGLAVESENRYQTGCDTTAPNWICETIISLQQNVRTADKLKRTHMYTNGSYQNTFNSLFGRGLR